MTRAPRAPRAPQATLPGDQETLDRLANLSRLDADVDSLLDTPRVEVEVPSAAGPRTPQLSVPFDLQRPAAVPLTDIRPRQPTIPFELKAEEPTPLQVRAPQSSVAFELRRQVEEPESAETVSPRRWGFGIAVLLVGFVVGIVVVGLLRPAEFGALLGRWRH